MIKPDISRPGFVTIVDAKARKHLVSVSSVGKPQATGPRITYLTLRGYENLFVNWPARSARLQRRQGRERHEG